MVREIKMHAITIMADDYLLFYYWGWLMCFLSLQHEIHVKYSYVLDLVCYGLFTFCLVVSVFEYECKFWLW